MTYERQYGKPEGLPDRLEKWLEAATKDKSKPWIGFGVIDDLKLAIATLRGEPIPVPEPEKPAMEFDL